MRRAGANRVEEDSHFLTRQLITCIGNKRALLDPIGQGVDRVCRRLGRDRLRILDAFAGSGVVSRFFKRHAERLVSNDLESFAASAARSHLRNRSQVDLDGLAGAVSALNARADAEPESIGFIEELYAPRDESQISAGDRVFYTRRNARRLDTYRRELEQLPPELKALLLGPLLASASVRANTAGVFKGFYKDRRTRIGRFGGTQADALTRIRGLVTLDVPVLSRFECEVAVSQEDANRVVRQFKNLDLAYFDPPYNQHPYGSNYFMLNLLVDYQRPRELSRVSGIPTDWRRSGYNVRARSLELLGDLFEHADAPFLMVSFSDDGFISRGQMLDLLTRRGTVDVIETRYNTFRGSRNLARRRLHVTEQLFLVERG